MRAASLIVVGVMLLVGSSDAAGEDLTALSQAEREANAKAHYELGYAHHQIGEYALAIQEFKQAYLYRPLPLFLFDIAQAYRRAGDNNNAAQYYRRFLSERPRGPETEEARSYLAALEREPKAAPPAPSTGLAPSFATPAEPVRSPSLLAVPSSKPPSSVPQRRHRRWLWWTLGAAGVALVGAAVATAVVLAEPSYPATRLGSFTLGH